MIVKAIFNAVVRMANARTCGSSEPCVLCKFVDPGVLSASSLPSGSIYALGDCDREKLRNLEAPLVEHG
jgi:hypothetical protein